jgi:hypothetical protein
MNVGLARFMVNNTGYSEWASYGGSDSMFSILSRATLGRNLVDKRYLKSTTIIDAENGYKNILRNGGKFFQTNTVH